MKLGLHCARTYWIRGFTAFCRRGERSTRLVSGPAHRQYHEHGPDGQPTFARAPHTIWPVDPPRPVSPAPAAGICARDHGDVTSPWSGAPRC